MKFPLLTDHIQPRQFSSVQAFAATCGPFFDKLVNSLVSQSADIFWMDNKASMTPLKPLWLYENVLCNKNLCYLITQEHYEEVVTTTKV